VAEAHDTLRQECGCIAGVLRDGVKRWLVVCAPHAPERRLGEPV